MFYTVCECEVPCNAKAIKSIKGIITKGLTYEILYKIQKDDGIYYELITDDNMYYQIKGEYFREVNVD